MKNIHIANSYKVWSIKKMRERIESIIAPSNVYLSVKTYMNRSLTSMYIEWWLHNVGYYVTLPFKRIKWFAFINERCKHVDLEEWR